MLPQDHPSTLPGGPIPAAAAAAALGHVPAFVLLVGGVGAGHASGRINTRYMDAAVSQLRTDGFDVRDEDVARLSPFVRHHINNVIRGAAWTGWMEDTHAA